LSSRDLANLLVEAAEEKKAWDPVILDLQGKTTIADYFVICEGETDRQLRAIADEMITRARKQRVRPLLVDGYDDATWILLDFDSVLAHIFLPGERSYYDLEALWGAVQAAREQVG
jgi:ribosome-associated protein